MKRTLTALLLCFAASACRHGGGGVSIDASAKFQPSPRPKTQSPEISINNLDGEISDAERRAPKEPFFRDGLPDKLVQRASYLGTTKDYDEADETSRKNLELEPNNVQVMMTRAHVLSTLHEFDDALKELDVAAAHGAPGDDVARARASIDLATGKCVEADKLWPPMPFPIDMATRGAMQQRLGRPGVAEELFERARVEFKDVSPFPLAWMDFERARAFEREGDREKARAYLEDALAALPQYAHAAVHAATVEPPDVAIGHLLVVEKRADDPDVFAAHADALRREKHDDEARAMTERARARFEDVLAKHPQAFADHAARFFLGEGGDVKRALALAKSAAANGPTEETLELLLLAARAAGDDAEACAAVAAAEKTTCPLRGSRANFDLAKKTCKP